MGARAGAVETGRGLTRGTGRYIATKAGALQEQADCLHRRSAPESAMNSTDASAPPTIVWFRRDLRLADNAALLAAVARGGAVLPVFLRDSLVDGLGAAPSWRLGLGLEALARSLGARGSRLVLRSGPALAALERLIEETGARAVYWSRAYDAQSIARDSEIRAALRACGIEARSFPGHLLFEPWDAQTKQGGFFRVYTPFWRAVSGGNVPKPEPAPPHLPAPSTWPASEELSDWQLGRRMSRGAAIVAPHLAVGEAAARARLDRFLAGPVEQYRERRDYPAEEATSRLSENLALGEISPRSVWHAGAAAEASGAAGAGHFLKELVWREFAWHLLFHTPHIAERNWRPEWDAFPWRGDAPEAEAWRRGMTGVTLVDAAMREMYVTGTMHNRGRMIVASYLTKHLLTDWRVGLRWFEECLADWDPASNAMGWQWAAGSGPDAAPYFRIFNPETQAEKFDPDMTYRRRFVAELTRRGEPPAPARAFFDAVPRSWALDPTAPYPAPAVTLAEGRARALAAYEQSRSAPAGQSA